MLYSLRGELFHVEPGVAVVECGGVGFKCNITMTTARSLPSIGGDVMLYTMMNVREDAIELFGFAEQNELRIFRQLTSVSGVGPKAAISILSEMTPERVALAVAGGDFKTITRAQGVGPKLAQRIILELKDKMTSLQTSNGEFIPPAAGDGVVSGGMSAASNAAEAVQALTVLGFTSGEASAAVGRLDSGMSVEQLVRESLKSLARK